MAHVPGASARAVDSLINYSSDLKIGLVQFPVQGCRSMSDLLMQMAEYACAAKAEGAGLVVFPELLAWDLLDEFSGSTTRDLERLACEVWPSYQAGVLKMAQQFNLPILAGTFPRLTAEGVMNTALMAWDSGAVLQDKLLLTPEERAMGWVPGGDIKTFEGPWGRTAILVCYDSQSPRVSAMLSDFAPELILVPSMTFGNGCRRVRAAAQALAVSHHCYVAVTGVVDAPKCQVPGLVGQAVLFTPVDHGFPGVAAEGQLGVSGLTFGECSFAQLRASRKRDEVVWAGRDERVHARFR